MKILENQETKPFASVEQIHRRLKSNWVDAVLMGFSPMLIIGMICCLVFFLVTVLYSGNFTIRLMYIFGLFTFASVFTARIAIEQSRSIATAYAAILGFATFCVTLRFVQFSGALAPFSIPATIVFLALIAFLADRITHDCTLIDESSDGASEGLLQTLGMVPSNVRAKDREQRPTDQMLATAGPERGSQDGTAVATKAKVAKKKHNPGVWVLYFAFLAVPLFGLGQIMIPSWDRVRNQLAFVFLVGYWYCTLSLLVVTSLLSLRRYLRRRQIEMPLGITAVWFLSGIFGIVGILGVLSFISLPSGNTGLLSLPFTITTPEGMKASPNGWGPEGVLTEKPNGNANQPDPAGKTAKPEKQNAAPKRKSSDNSTSSADSKNDSADANENQARNIDSKDGSPRESGSQSDKNQSNNESKSDSAKQNADKDQSAESPPASPEKTSDNDRNNKNERPPSQQQEPQPQQGKANQSEPESKPKQIPEKAPEKSAEQPSKQPDNQEVNKTAERNAEQPKDVQAQKPNEEPASKPDARQQSDTPSSWSIALTGGISELLRWLLMVALAIFLLYCAIRYRADLANAWRQLLESLSGFFNIRRPTLPESFEDAKLNQLAIQARKNSFNDFADPFQQNQSQWTPPKIVSHTFQAIEAWGSERNLPRTSNETAEEYLTRLATRYPIQSESFQRLTGLYNRLAYAAKSVDSSESNKLASLWSWLRKTTSQ
ncbi:MAG: DUF4129 domain-containing protein [Planctomycetota bacterium]|nr:DUF4129 domain-containing protein [Planctomycetota bacterium]